MSESPVTPGWGLLIYNAGGGSASKCPPSQLLAALRKNGADVRLHEFIEGDQPADIVRKALANGAKWIAAAGGDGTVEATAKALTGTDIPLGVIPCGTYNNFARSASLPDDPIAACAVIAAGHTREIDVGMVNGMPFFECVGVGLDAAVFSLGEEVKSGALFKTWDFFRRAARYPLHRFEIELDRPFGEALILQPGNASERRLQRAYRNKRERKLKVRAWMITISNGPYYGMNFAVAPDASVDDAMLTVTIFKRFSKLRLWWHFFSIHSGRKTPSPRVIALRATRVRIDRPNARAAPADTRSLGRWSDCQSLFNGHHAHADGHPVTTWPVEISLRPHSLRVFFVKPNDQQNSGATMPQNNCGHGLC